MMILSEAKCLEIEQIWGELWLKMQPLFEPVIFQKYQFTIEPKIVGSVSRRTAILDSDLDVLLVYSSSIDSLDEVHKYTSEILESFSVSISECSRRKIIIRKGKFAFQTENMIFAF